MSQQARETPYSPENQAATRDNERAVFAARAQHEQDGEHARFQPGSEQAVSDPLTLTEWRDEAMRLRELHAATDALLRSRSIQLATARTDADSAREDLADARRQLDTERKANAQLRELLRDISNLAKQG